MLDQRWMTDHVHASRGAINRRTCTNHLEMWLPNGSNHQLIFAHPCLSMISTHFTLISGRTHLGLETLGSLCSELPSPQQTIGIRRQDYSVGEM
jgi:hypothetical protein